MERLGRNLITWKVDRTDAVIFFFFFLVELAHFITAILKQNIKILSSLSFVTKLFVCSQSVVVMVHVLYKHSKAW